MVASLSRKEIDDLTKYVSIYGAKGLAYIKINDRFRRHRRITVTYPKILTRTGYSRPFWTALKRRTGDLIFFGADKAKVVNEAMGALRVKLGTDHGLLEEGWKPVWVVDFPMFEWDENQKQMECAASSVYSTAV